jgi:hypothetical protein
MSAPMGRRASKAKPGGSTAKAIAAPATPGVARGRSRAKAEIEPSEIARLAYSYWETRGAQGGSPEEDWLRAEQQLRAGK